MHHPQKHGVFVDGGKFEKKSTDEFGGDVAVSAESE